MIKSFFELQVATRQGKDNLKTISKQFGVDLFVNILLEIIKTLKAFKTLFEFVKICFNMSAMFNLCSYAQISYLFCFEVCPNYVNIN